MKAQTIRRLVGYLMETRTPHLPRLTSACSRCCQGPNETDALTVLLAYGPKYASILAGTRLGFAAPKELTELVVVERLPGTATTDFGAPSVAVALKASATGAIPSKGPRGGTRWTARYFVRRVAWHGVAHPWEIERRTAAVA